MEQNEPHLIVDVHEPLYFDDMLCSITKISREPLEVGDYVVKDVVIERKDIGDFFGSLTSGRIWDQCYYLMKKAEINESRSLIVIIGDIIDYMRKRNHRIDPDAIGFMTKRLDSFCLVSYLSFGIPVFHLKSEERFVKLVEEIWKRRTKTSSLKPVQKKSSSLPDIKSDIFACIPGIGRKMSDALAKEYSVLGIALMDEEKIKEIKVDGRRLCNKASKIKEVLTK